MLFAGHDGPSVRRYRSPDPPERTGPQTWPAVLSPNISLDSMSPTIDGMCQDEARLIKSQG